MTNQVPWEAMRPVDGMRRVSPHRARAMTSPTHPQILFPAHRPSTVHTSDLFFVPPQKGIRPTTSSFVGAPVTPGNSGAYLHTSHRSFTSPPPIPPKPFAMQQERPEVQLLSHVADIPQPDARREKDELSVALALSQSESTQRQSMLDKLNSQEEEDLSRALAESLKTAPSIPGAAPTPDTIHPIPESTTPTRPSHSGSAVSSTSDNVGLATGSKGKGRLNERPITRSSHPRPIVNTVRDFDDDPCANDEAIARRLEEEESSLSRISNNNTDWIGEGAASAYLGRSQSLPPSSQLLAEDEMYARHLAEQEAEMSSPVLPRSKSALATVSGTHTSELSDLPPPYEASPSALPGHPSSVSGANFLSPSSRVTRNRSVGSQSFAPSEPTLERSYPLSGMLSSPITITSDQNPSDSPQPLHQVDHSHSSTSLSSSLSSPVTDRVLEDSQNTITTINPYVADELLRGVSIGFEPPLISTQILPWKDPLPTIISLPYGRSLPLHIQATSWRHMLKLLTRLPGTTIQATIDAMAVTKSDHRLRIVVQYVKPHLVSTEWRTVLWFTLEHPVPEDVTGRSRYLNDVNILPWSYTFSEPPQLLRGGAERQSSKTYTIPACNSLPFPTLPITFPVLAMYLIEAVEISRRHANDSSSGFRKLVKMTEICYPDMNANEADDPDKNKLKTIPSSFWAKMSTAQWRAPIALQIIFAAIMIIAVHFLPESPRWLIKANRPAEAMAVVSALVDKSPSEAGVEQTFQAILEAVALEDLHPTEEPSNINATSKTSLNELFTGGRSQNFRRVMLGVTLLFERLGIPDAVSRIIAACNATEYFMASLIAILLIDRIGRRKLMLYAAAGQCLTMVILAVLGKLNTAPARIASAVFLFVFNSIFAIGWLGMTWLYPAEIIGLRARGPGNALSTASNWMWNFFVVMIAGPLFANIGWKTYIVFASLNAFIIPVVYLYFPETAGRSLEDMDIIFAVAYEERISLVKASFRKDLPMEGSPKANRILGSITRRISRQ
ncbi:hypothetical protein APHAL10511_001764 [Amanita phalloides]|nr:hypothetical protein APHAL10511_001764 [Amanita phalloides]